MMTSAILDLVAVTLSLWLYPRFQRLIRDISRVLAIPWRNSALLVLKPSACCREIGPHTRIKFLGSISAR